MAHKKSETSTMRKVLWLAAIFQAASVSFLAVLIFVSTPQRASVERAELETAAQSHSFAKDYARSLERLDAAGRKVQMNALVMGTIALILQIAYLLFGVVKSRKVNRPGAPGDSIEPRP